MMGYLYNGYGYGNVYGSGMMSTGFGLVSLIFCLIILIDAVLLGIWLWQQISKK